MKDPGFEGSAFEALVLAVSVCGSRTELARRLNKGPGLVWHWLHRDGQVPIEYVASVVQAVNDPRVTPLTLRPDYPHWRTLAVQLVCAHIDDALACSRRTVSQSR